MGVFKNERDDKAMPVFVSHSFKDEAVYTAVCLAVDAAGIKRWSPEAMSAGDSLAGQLRDAISQCEVCAFIATRRSIESPWCLAELGAFWGAGKRVLLFMADPDLSDAMLPPQFKGNLRVNTAQELIKALAAATEGHATALAKAKADAPYEFFETSGNYGKEKDWQSLLEGTEKHFDILGVALMQWRKTSGFKETVIRKARSGCSVRILLMHEDNQVLGRLLYDDRELESVRGDIKETYSFYSGLAAKHPNIQVRQIHFGIPHFFLTRTDLHAIIVQYLSSETWGAGPTWRCPVNSSSTLSDRGLDSRERRGVESRRDATTASREMSQSPSNTPEGT